MKFIIKHDVPGRIRVHMDASGMTFTQADTLQYYLKNLQGVTNAKVYERTADAVVEYRCSRKTVIEAIARFRYSNVEVPEDVLATSGRAINSHYTEKLADQVLWRMTKKLFIPAPVCAVLTTVSSMKYIYKGIRTLLARKLEVPVLDATAIGVSILRRDFNTAGSVMFLLGIGEIIEDWTHKKSVDDLARTMSLNVNKVWLKTDDAEVQVSVKDVKDGDNVIIRMGNVIPFDGTVISGEAMVNQASLTGESEPVRRCEGTSVFAGTVVEEGEIVFRVKRAGGSSKYDKIVRMIEESEKLKSGLGNLSVYDGIVITLSILFNSSFFIVSFPAPETPDNSTSMLSPFLLLFRLLLLLLVTLPLLLLMVKLLLLFVLLFLMLLLLTQICY